MACVRVRVRVCVLVRVRVCVYDRGTSMQFDSNVLVTVMWGAIALHCSIKCSENPLTAYL